ncbi:MAG: hypothetical protein HY747_10620, partial [Elusimicrobia bacterium]|nr:hypothetical protein [Elusimicrobiota bacterium]
GADLDTSNQPGITISTHVFFGTGATISTYTMDTGNLDLYGTIADNDLSSAITRDTDWDTISEINTASTDADIIATNSSWSGGDLSGTGLAATVAANSVDGTNIALRSDAQGDVMYYNGTDWARLTAGASGQFLRTQGVATPQWSVILSSELAGSNLPGGSTSYIQNTNELQSGATFYVSSGSVQNNLVIWGKLGVGVGVANAKIAVIGGVAASEAIKGGVGAPDVAENILATDEMIEAADIVVADPKNPERIIKSSRPYQRGILGIISTKPGILTNADAGDIDGSIEKDKRQRPLALAGRVPVKVTLENGPIRIGDYLTSSSKPGYAMKATEPGVVIGVALENFPNGDLQSSTQSHEHMGRLTSDELKQSNSESRHSTFDPVSSHRTALRDCIRHSTFQEGKVLTFINNGENNLTEKVRSLTNEMENLKLELLKVKKELSSSK